MEVILLRKFRGLGNVGQIVNVKDGYGNNYLIPKNFALRATKSNQKKFEDMRKDLEEKIAQEKTAIEKDSLALNGFVLHMVKEASNSGSLYGSISQGDIASELLKHGFNVHKKNIVTGTIKKVGSYHISIALHPEVDCAIDLNITTAEH